MTRLSYGWKIDAAWCAERREMSNSFRSPSIGHLSLVSVLDLKCFLSSLRILCDVDRAYPYTTIDKSQFAGIIVEAVRTDHVGRRAYSKRNAHHIPLGPTRNAAKLLYPALTLSPKTDMARIYGWISRVLSH